METQLKEAAAAYLEAPKRLREAIIAAAREGEQPADITRAIGHAYSRDYVAKLIRDTLGSKGPGRPPSRRPSKRPKS